MSSTTRTIGPLHFEDLEPHRFEDLVRQLVYDFRPWRALEATGRAGSDDSFDARGFEVADAVDALPAEQDDPDADEARPATTDDRIWLVQCKREQTITPARIKKHLDDIPLTSLEGLYGVVFVAACDFSKKTRDAFRDWCRAAGVSEAHLWGKAELEDQFFQPKNDGLLFTYFGISLRIRRRSIRTQLRTRLAMKRKCERTLDQTYVPVLLRDPTDDRYPYVSGDDARVNPMRWRVRRYIGHCIEGLLLEIRNSLAYIADDGKSWDMVLCQGDTMLSPYDDPWHDQAGKEREDLPDRFDVLPFWEQTPEMNRATISVCEVLPYEAILDVDEKGDELFRRPHIYAENILKLGLRAKLTNSAGFAPTVMWPHPPDRVRYFPAEFPKRREVANRFPE